MLKSDYALSRVLIIIARLGEELQRMYVYLGQVGLSWLIKAKYVRLRDDHASISIKSEFFVVCRSVVEYMTWREIVCNDVSEFYEWV